MADARTLQRGLDRAHRIMKKLGFGRFLFGGFADLDRVFPEPTTKQMRVFEYKGFVLVRPTMNTQDQQGYLQVKKIVH